MMSYLKYLLRSYLEYRRWKWIGTARGESYCVGDNGERVRGGDMSRIWNLYVRGNGARRYEHVGGCGASQAAIMMEAEVKAWQHGGPLPKLYSKADQGKNPPGKKADLIVFPGGKGAA